MKNYYVYIITNKNNSVFYTGVTNNIEIRMQQHKNKIVKGFSSKYNLSRLVYLEKTNSAEDAIKREKQLKKWNRQWKIDLIKSLNPEFKNRLQ